MFYFFKYNGVNLTNMARVRTVENTVLPPRENNSITIWEKPGSIYNGYRYGERRIVVTFLVRSFKKDSVYAGNEVNSIMKQLGSIFDVDSPKPLYLGESTSYINAVMDGEFKVREIRYDCVECEITFICHDPRYYSSFVQSVGSFELSYVVDPYPNTYGLRNRAARSNSGNKTLNVYNNGDSAAFPIINLDINTDNTSFVQVENATTGQKFLIGEYLDSSKGYFALPAESVILPDTMDSLDGWIPGTDYIDSSRDNRGTMTTTKVGDGIMLGSIASDYTSVVWYGASASKQLSKPLTNFTVKARMSHNSTGVNGDPTDLQPKDDAGVIISGGTDVYYKVTAASLPVRESPSPNARVICTLAKGAEVTSDSIDKGWAQVYANGTYGYCYTQHLKKYYSDSSTTDLVMNVIATVDTELRSAASDDINISRTLSTIPKDTELRVYKEKIDGYYKLYTTYNGKVGYVDASAVLDSEGLIVNYAEDEVIAPSDELTGTCEVYGYSADGTKLFKLSVSDDNRYYEYTKPAVDIGDNIVLQDNTSVPNPNSASNNIGLDELNVGFDNLENGTLGSWNNFYGELGIQRKNGKWQAWIYKIDNGSTVKKLLLKEQTINDASDKQLAYITIYIGTQDGQRISGMSISDLVVTEINNVDPETQNIARFRAGDEIQIDCYNNRVYLNNQLYNDIDICSNFIELATGNNTIKVISDDFDVCATVLFNERYM